MTKSTISTQARNFFAIFPMNIKAVKGVTHQANGVAIYRATTSTLCRSTQRFTSKRRAQVNWPLVTG